MHFRWFNSRNFTENCEHRSPWINAYFTVFRWLLQKKVTRLITFSFLWFLFLRSQRIVFFSIIFPLVPYFTACHLSYKTSRVKFSKTPQGHSSKLFSTLRQKKSNNFFLSYPLYGIHNTQNVLQMAKVLTFLARVTFSVSWQFLRIGVENLA